VPDGLRTLAGLASNPGLEGSFSARLDEQACYEIKFSDRHRGSACVLSKLQQTIITLRLKGA